MAHLIFFLALTGYKRGEKGQENSVKETSASFIFFLLSAHLFVNGGVNNLNMADRLAENNFTVPPLIVSSD